MPSAVIRSFQYDEAAQTLLIVFQSGRRYRYLEVPPETFGRMRAAFAKGVFFNSHIRDRFRYVEESAGRPVLRTQRGVVMERPMILEHLAQAERHVAEGESHLAKQRTLITELDKGGHDTTAAHALLRQFEELQALHIADRDRLRDELSAVTKDAAR